MAILSNVSDAAAIYRKYKKMWYSNCLLASTSCVGPCARTCAACAAASKETDEAADVSPGSGSKLAIRNLGSSLAAAFSGGGSGMKDGQKNERAETVPEGGEEATLEGTEEGGAEAAKRSDTALADLEAGGSTSGSTSGSISGREESGAGVAEEDGGGGGQGGEEETEKDGQGQSTDGIEIEMGGAAIPSPMSTMAGNPNMSDERCASTASPTKSKRMVKELEQGERSRGELGLRSSLPSSSRTPHPAPRTPQTPLRSPISTKLARGQ